MQTFHKQTDAGVSTCFGGLVTYKTSNAHNVIVMFKICSVICSQNIHFAQCKDKGSFGFFW